MNTFFISTPLGFERDTLAEMKTVWPLLLAKSSQPHDLPFPEVSVLQGGLEFQTEMFTALQLNFFLKTANRILLRMASFKARDLPKFYQKMKSLPWLEFLKDAHVEWEVAAKTSRVNNEKRLQESATAALEEIFKGKKSDAETCGSIYIRMEDDLCTISLDTTGDHLHKRGWTSLKGEAPLRESLAVYMLKALIGETSAEQLQKITLFDPMMGSGTFLCEARGLKSGHFQRPYAFQRWKSAPKLFLSPQFALNYKMSHEKVFAAYEGQDLEERMVPVATENFQEVERQLELVQKKDFVKAELKLSYGDSLALKDMPAKDRYIVLNPPYGERLDKAGGQAGLVTSFCLLKPLKLGVLFPEKERLKSAPMGYRVAKELKINNGGIRCLFSILERL